MISATRILGFVWHYLTLWAWSINMLAVVAIGWTAVLAWANRDRAPHPAAARAGLGAIAVVLVAWTAMFSFDAVDAEPTQANYSQMVGEFTAATTEAIDDGSVEGGGPGSRYLLTWTDGVNLGSTGYGLLNELERRGYDAGVIGTHGPGARPHRVLPIREATAEVHISLGPDIELWDAKPDAERVLYTTCAPTTRWPPTSGRAPRPWPSSRRPGSMTWCPSSTSRRSSCTSTIACRTRPAPPSRSSTTSASRRPSTSARSPCGSDLATGP
jgi:hypothetical protein